MQEIVLILSSLAGVATAAAVRKIPRNKNQLLSIGASSHIKTSINSLKIEKDILTKTISRLYQADSEFAKIQKDRLLSKYQHQLGVVLAKLEKLEQASNHPDLGPVGDGLITLMDQKLSKLDDRLYELSSKITTKVQTPDIEPEIKEKPAKPAKPATIEPKQGIDPVQIPATKPGSSFELTTLTNITKEPKFPLFEKGHVPKSMPRPKIIQTELIRPKVDDKTEIIQSIAPNPAVTAKPETDKPAPKTIRPKALPEPIKEKPSTLDDDDFDDDDDDLDKIKGNIMKVLSKIDQAEVE